MRARRAGSRRGRRSTRGRCSRRPPRARATRSRTVLPLDRAMRSASVPRSGFASTAMIRSSRASASAMPSSIVTVVLPTPPLRDSTGTKRAPPLSGAAIRRSSSLRARACLPSPRLMRCPEIVYRKCCHAPSGSGPTTWCGSSRRSAVSRSARLAICFELAETLRRQCDLRGLRGDALDHLDGERFGRGTPHDAWQVWNPCWSAARTTAAATAPAIMSSNAPDAAGAP